MKISEPVISDIENEFHDVVTFKSKFFMLGLDEFSVNYRKNLKHDKQSYDSFDDVSNLIIRASTLAWMLIHTLVHGIV